MRYWGLYIIRYYLQQPNQVLNWYQIFILFRDWQFACGFGGKWNQPGNPQFFHQLPSLQITLSGLHTLHFNYQIKSMSKSRQCSGRKSAPLVLTPTLSISHPQPPSQSHKEHSHGRDNKEQEKSTRLNFGPRRQTNFFEHFTEADLRSGRFKPWHLIQECDLQNNLLEVEENKQNWSKEQSDSDDQINELNFEIQTPASWSLQAQTLNKGQETSPFRRLKRIKQPIARKNNRRQRNKEKGLRKLSAHAFRAVKQLGQATYKEVSSCLIGQMMMEESIMDEFKQENNIKRRVYDALNVLIALGVLKKKGHLIYYDQNSKYSRFEQMFEKKLDREKELMQKQTSLEEKRQGLAQIQQKIESMEKLIDRNTKDLAVDKERINFPFVCIQVPRLKLNEKLSQKIKLSPDKTRFQMHVEDSFSFFGDVDSLQKSQL